MKKDNWPAFLPNVRDWKRNDWVIWFILVLIIGYAMFNLLELFQVLPL